MSSKKCPSGKRRFKDEIAAALAIAKIQQKDDSRREKTEQRYYRCPQCGGIHITSRGKKKRA